ncbi:kelch-like protein 41a isoform X1 [Drosophila suzukii]|uniref:Kelch-like protein 41a isoform X1 n=1 Tax=Drosophila suzukii TaxID=28584 RepID=A0AB39ZQA7_DROSZ
MSIWSFRTSPNTRLRGSLIDLGRTNRHTDCNFIIEQENGTTKSFPCHRLILSCASDVFDRMLYGDYNESATGEVRLNDVGADIFEKFRDYVYGYEYDKLQKYDFDTLIRLCEFGNKYLVHSLEDDCVRELLVRKDSFDMGELLRIFACAHRMNKKSLIDQMSWELKSTFRSTLDHSVVYEFNCDVFKHYIEVIAGKLSEADRFRLLEMYLKYNGFEAPENLSQVENVQNSESELPSTSCLPLEIGCSSTNPAKEEAKRPNYVRDLLGLIDFSNLTPKEFYEGPGKSSFLSLTQKYEHMYQIARNCVVAKEELQLKVGSPTEQTPLLSESRRIVTLGGTLIREEPTTTSLSSHYSPRSSRRFRTWSAHCDI